MPRQQQYDDNGPTVVYDVDSPALKKIRRQAKGGLATLDKAARQAYGAEVEKAIIAKQRASLLGTGDRPAFKAWCASGTFHSDGGDIGKAVLTQHRASLAACAGQERRARTPQQWADMYAEAMAEKRRIKS